MSDTDKDKPDWVTAEWWEPVHLHCEHDTTTYYRTVAKRSCDLPDRPVVTRDRPRFIRWRLRSEPVCYWAPRWERPYHRYAFTNVPRWFVHHVWTGAERASVRDDCRRAATEYRATGEVDTVPSVRQHRHNAVWLWD
jgi:hypothetical protein